MSKSSKANSSTRTTATHKTFTYQATEDEQKLGAKVVEWYTKYGVLITVLDAVLESDKTDYKPQDYGWVIEARYGNADWIPITYLFSRKRRVGREAIPAINRQWPNIKLRVRKYIRVGR